jgi:hypothetical protein
MIVRSSISSAPWSRTELLMLAMRVGVPNGFVGSQRATGAASGGSASGAASMLASK